MLPRLGKVGYNFGMIHRDLIAAHESRAEGPLRALLHRGSNWLYCTVAPDGLITASGGGALATLALPVDGVGQRLEQLFSEVPTVATLLARALAGEHLASGQWHLGGRIFEVQLGPQQDSPDGAICGATLLGNDVTSWVKAAAAARWTETVLAHVSQGAPIVISVYDKNGVFVSHTGRAITKLGLQPNQLQGQSVFEAFKGADEALRMITEALQGNANSNTQDLGATIWDNWFSPIKDADQNIIGALSISTDVTDRERAHAAVREQLHQLKVQSHALREMAAPIIQIWKGVLVVPVIGQLDSERVSLITAALLDSIVQTRAHAAILDLTAVAQVDTSTADHLVRIIRAVSLLGARGLISGIAPAVAQTIVSMGVDLSQITTLASLHEALRLFIK